MNSLIGVFLYVFNWDKSEFKCLYKVYNEVPFNVVIVPQISDSTTSSFHSFAFSHNEEGNYSSITVKF